MDDKYRNMFPKSADPCYVRGMSSLTLGGGIPSSDRQMPHIYCPSLRGLSVRVADAAFLMPRIDHNQTVKDAKGCGHWASTIAADPFGSNSAYFTALVAAGYVGVVNWPSSILLEGQTRQQMSTIPATPDTEYRYLANAQDFGLSTLGFILTPDHAAVALKLGLRNLVLHPGLLLDVDAAGVSMIRGALSSIVANVKAMEPTATVRLYTSDWHESILGLSDVTCDGLVCFEAARP